MHDDRNTVSSNNRFEILKELTAWTLALLSVAIYPVVIHATAETNRKKGIHYPLGIELRDIASGVLINLLLNKFAAKESINNDILLYQQKEFRQLLTVTLVALICAAGQAFIAYCDADGNLKLPSAFATEVGIAVLSALSLAQLEKLVVDHALLFRARRFLGKTTEADNYLVDIRNHVLSNLQFMQAVLRKSNIRSLNPTASSALQAILNLDGKINPVLNLPAPLRYVGAAFTLISSMIVSATLLFCILAYMCATDISFQKYLPGMKHSHQASMWLAIASMFPPALLAIIAGFNFVSTVSDLLVTRVVHGRFPNDMTLGKGIYVAGISALLTALIASFSGQTTADLLQTCPKSLMGVFMLVNTFTSSLARISSSTFNWYFAVQAVFPLIGKLARKCVSDNEKAYQKYQEGLNELIQQAKNAKTEEALPAKVARGDEEHLRLTQFPAGFRNALFTAPRAEVFDTTVVPVADAANDVDDAAATDRLLNQGKKSFCCVM